MGPGAGFAGIAYVTAVFLWSTRRTPASELEAFWEPFFRDRNTIQICIGQPTRLYRFTGPRTEELNRRLGGSRSPETTCRGFRSIPRISWVAPEYLFLRDAVFGFKLASWIQSKGAPFN